MGNKQRKKKSQKEKRKERSKSLKMNKMMMLTSKLSYKLRAKVKRLRSRNPLRKKAKKLFHSNSSNPKMNPTNLQIKLKILNRMNKRF